MPRRAKPWYWKARKIWCAYIDGEKTNLGTTRDDAYRRFHEIMSKPEEVRHPIPEGCVVGVLDDFITLCHWRCLSRPRMSTSS